MNDKTKKVTKLCCFLFLAALAVGLAAQPLSAQVTIPQGSAVNSAVFHVYVAATTNMPVTVHRITAEWAEGAVTYANFGNSYAAAVEGTFTTTVGWQTVDLTSLVQAWALGIYPNYGIAMVETQPGTGTPYWSSEYLLFPDLRPKLVIGYTPPGGSLTYVTIQRPAGGTGFVADSWITAQHETANNGTDENLVTGFINT